MSERQPIGIPNPIFGKCMSVVLVGAVVDGLVQFFGIALRRFVRVRSVFLVLTFGNFFESMSNLVEAICFESSRWPQLLDVAFWNFPIRFEFSRDCFAKIVFALLESLSKLRDLVGTFGIAIAIDCDPSTREEHRRAKMACFPYWHRLLG